MLYVRAGGPVGGAGTQVAPFASIGAALPVALPGTILALGKGTFDELIQLPAGITLWGACVANTHLTSSTAGSAPTVKVTGGMAVIRNLHIGSPRPGVWLQTAGASVEVRDLVISGAHSAGISVFSAGKVTGSRVVIRDTQPTPALNTLGQGIEAGEGAQIKLAWVIVESSRLAGLLAGGQGTLIELSDASVRDTLGEASSGFYGYGLSSYDSARIQAQRVTLERNRTSGTNAETGGVVVLADAVVRDSLPSTNQPLLGVGGFALAGGRLELRRVLVQHNRFAGLRVYGALSVLDLTDVVVRDTLEVGTSGGQGSGIVASVESRVQGARIALEHNRRAGLAAQGVKTVIDVEDVTVLGTSGTTAEAFGGLGISVLTGGQVTVRRALLDDNQCEAIGAADDGSVLTLSDVTVRNTRACLDGEGGEGLVVSKAHASVTRGLFENNQSAAILAGNAGTLLTLTDVTARDTASHLSLGGTYGEFGESLHAQQGAQVEVSRVVFERSHEVGVFVSYGARISGTDVVIRDTLEVLCPPASCLAQGGIGAAAVEGGSLVLSVFSIIRSAHLGLELAKAGTADLQSGEISENPIGVNIQSPDFDLARIQRDVVFRDNVQTLNSALLPLPQPTHPIR